MEVSQIRDGKSIMLTPETENEYRILDMFRSENGNKLMIYDMTGEQNYNTGQATYVFRIGREE